METTITATLEQFKVALGTVAELGNQVANQEQAVLADEAATLAQIIADVKKIMRYIDYEVKASGFCAGNQWASWKYTYMPEHGIVLTGQREEVCTDGDTRGDFEGHDLVLSRSGTLFYRTYAGSWSRWQGESENWTTTDDDPDTEYDGAGHYDTVTGSTVEVTPAEALTHYSFEGIVGEFVAEVQKAIAKTQTKQQTLGGRLAKLEAAKAALR